MACCYVFGPLLAVISPMATWNVIRNDPKKRELLRRYEIEGIEVEGITLEKKTIVRTNKYGCETGRSFYLSYAYRFEEETCMKPMTLVPELPADDERSVKLLVLPEMPYSGCLEMIVKRREDDYFPCKSYAKAIACFLVHLMGLAFPLALFFCADSLTVCASHTLILPAMAAFSLLINAMSYLRASGTFARWKHQMLYQNGPTTLQRGQFRQLPTAQVVDRMEEIDVELASRAEQAASSPDFHGSTALAKAIKENDDP